MEVVHLDGFKASLGNIRREYDLVFSSRFCRSEKRRIEIESLDQGLVSV
jgi:hypothetical protein